MRITEYNIGQHNHVICGSYISHLFCDSSLLEGEVIAAEFAWCCSACQGLSSIRMYIRLDDKYLYGSTLA